jgi:hypothetical protein
LSRPVPAEQVPALLAVLAGTPGSA